MHGCAPGSGGPPGERNGMYRHGRYTREAKQVSKFFRQMAKDADVMTATVAHAHGFRPIKAIRRKAHVRKALAKAKASKGEKTE
jgi:hypothetical protein